MSPKDLKPYRRIGVHLIDNAPGPRWYLVRSNVAHACINHSTPLTLEYDSKGRTLWHPWNIPTLQNGLELIADDVEFDIYGRLVAPTEKELMKRFHVPMVPLYRRLDDQYNAF